jgi:exodeoxyribonuclease VII small subunit
MTANQSNQSSQPDFAAKLQELEAITTWFESGEVDLNQALAKFERGLGLADELKRELQQVENRVETIKARFDATVGEGAASEPDSEAAGAPSADAPPPVDDGSTLF